MEHNWRSMATLLGPFLLEQNWPAISALQMGGSGAPMGNLLLSALSKDLAKFHTHPTK